MTGIRTEFPSTDFAITSVNVPDRLDLREVDDRKQQDEASSLYARGSLLRIWWRRLLPYLVLVALLALAGKWLASERETLAASRIAQRLSAALHVPVHVQDSRFRTAPAPAMVLTGVDLGGQIRLDEVVLQFTAPSLWQAVVSGQRRWGDVVISPITLSLDQANQLLTWLAALERAVPDSVTKVRISELRVVGTGLLPDRYEAYARREANGQFSSVILRRAGGSGSMQLQLTPDRAGGPIAFQCDGADWQPPFAPRIAWTEFVGSGHLAAGSISLDRFTLGSSFGAVEGQLSVQQQDHATPAWLASGHVSTAGIDIGTLIQQVTNPSQPTKDSSELPPAPMAGTAAIEAALAGAGATPEEALGKLLAEGEIKVRSAALNGINLGFAATRPSAVGAGSGSASTRFTRFETSFVAGSDGVLFRKIHGLAGALSTRGELAVAHDLGIDGLLHVDLGGSRIQAPLRIHVRGTIDHPKFGR